jgi:hypothetical protein
MTPPLTSNKAHSIPLLSLKSNKLN